jgi:hypothetical protein
MFYSELFGVNTQELKLYASTFYSLFITLFLTILFWRFDSEKKLAHEYFFFSFKSRYQLALKDLDQLYLNFDFTIFILLFTILIARFGSTGNKFVILTNSVLLSINFAIIYLLFLIVNYSSSIARRKQNIKNILAFINLLVILPAVFREKYELANVLFSSSPLTGIYFIKDHYLTLLIAVLIVIIEMYLIRRSLSQWKVH